MDAASPVPEAPSPLVLGARTGLPDEVAVLRALHPREAWRGHANFGQLANFWLHVHAALRSEGSKVVELVAAFRDRHVGGRDFGQAFVPALNGFLQHLDQHHRIEDHAYFPKFRSLDQRLSVGFDLLEADHALIHHHLVETVEHARELLRGVATSDAQATPAAEAFSTKVEKLLALLGQHLSDEEELVIPAILHHGERPFL